MFIPSHCFNISPLERAWGDFVIRGFNGESYRQCLKGLTISEEALKRRMSVGGIYTCVSYQLRQQCSRRFFFFFLSSSLLTLISFSPSLKTFCLGEHNHSCHPIFKENNAEFSLPTREVLPLEKRWAAQTACSQPPALSRLMGLCGRPAACRSAGCWACAGQAGAAAAWGRRRCHRGGGESPGTEARWWDPPEAAPGHWGPGCLYGLPKGKAANKEGSFKCTAYLAICSSPTENTYDSYL